MRSKRFPNKKDEQEIVVTPIQDGIFSPCIISYE